MSQKELRRKLRAAHRRSQVLDAAKGVFMDREFSSVTMEDIADQAGLSRATVYQYFSSKQELYTAVLIKDLEGLIDGLTRSLIEEDTVRNNLFRMATEYMNFFRDRTEYFKSMSFFFFPGRREVLEEDAAELVRAKLNEGIETIERAIILGIERDEARAVDPRAATLSLWGQWMGCAYLGATGRIALYGRTTEQVYANSIDLFLDGLIVRQ